MKRAKLEWEVPDVRILPHSQMTPNGHLSNRSETGPLNFIVESTDIKAAIPVGGAQAIIPQRKTATASAS